MGFGLGAWVYSGFMIGYGWFRMDLGLVQGGLEWV